MCLTIKTIPVQEHGYFIVQKVYKTLQRGWDNTYYTPYRGAQVPRSGILLANKFDGNPVEDRRAWHNGRTQPVKRINGGYIHSYDDKDKNRTIYNTIYPALAINVVAYGTLHDVCSEAVYIPDTATRKTPSLSAILMSLEDNVPEYVEYDRILKALPARINNRLKDHQALEFV